MAVEFHSQQLQLAQASSTLPFLSTLKQQGAAAFAQASIPTRKTEAWKNTSLFNLTTHSYGKPANFVANNELQQVATIDGFNAARLVFVNGQLNTELSDALSLPNVTLFSQANAEQQALITKHLGAVIAQAHKTAHLFNDLNAAALEDGVLIYVPRNQSLSQPVQLSYLTSSDSQAVTINTRILLVMETSSEAVIVEQYASDNADQVSFTNALTEIVIGDNARLQHYRLQTMQEQAQHIGAVHVDLARDSQYNAFYLSLGSRLTRNDVVVNHNVGGSHSEIAGVYIPQNQHVVDYHTCIEHKVPNCTSNEVFRGIMNDKAKAIFNGRIHIHAQAQKTNAQLSNKNLLLTNTAEIYTKPELEIYADDVKCAHGATVAQLEDKARFYLQSRGISKRDAEVMLSFGFINELLEALPHEAITQLLRPILAKRFGREANEQLLNGVAQ